jgi:ribosomal protein S12 methylthiotransferase accessory factor YcaO
MCTAPLRARPLTLVTDLGVLAGCHAELELRVDPTDPAGEVFGGYGIAADALGARLAAEGEALERATWLAGMCWADLVCPCADAFLPEEARLLLPPGLAATLTAGPVAALPVTAADGEPRHIPAEAVFARPRLAQDRDRLSVTTGWAFRRGWPEAERAGYLEVIERDLLMLFWYGRLGPWLESLTPVQLAVAAPALMHGVAPQGLSVLCTTVRIAERFGGQGTFVVALDVGQEPPYLSAGMALKNAPDTAIAAALGECFAVRAVQYERLLADRAPPDQVGFAAHIARAATDADLQARALALVAGVRGDAAEPLCYRDLPFWSAHLRPPPRTRRGVVAKVWIDGCQPMLPAGCRGALAERWRTRFGVTEAEWEVGRWHPFP